MFPYTFASNHPFFLQRGELQTPLACVLTCAFPLLSASRPEIGHRSFSQQSTGTNATCDGNVYISRAIGERFTGRGRRGINPGGSVEVPIIDRGRIEKKKNANPPIVVWWAANCRQGNAIRKSGLIIDSIGAADSGNSFW